AVRHRSSLDGCEAERRGNHECVLGSPAEMVERFPGDRGAVARTVELAERLRFDLTEELGYRYPDFSDSPEPAIIQLGQVCNREVGAVPDVELDFPRDIRGKLLVAVTGRYGREHAALVASFATYRSRGAIRDVGKALGLPYAELERIARVSEGWNAKRVAEEL